MNIQCILVSSIWLRVLPEVNLSICIRRKMQFTFSGQKRIGGIRVKGLITTNVQQLTINFVTCQGKMLEMVFLHGVAITACNKIDKPLVIYRCVNFT